MVPAKLLSNKKAEYRYRLVSKLKCETQCRAEQDDHLMRQRMAKGNQVPIAAAEIDQVIRRIMDRAVADRCYEL